MRGNYTDPKTKPVSIIAHNLLDLLCIDIPKVDTSKDGKEIILVLTDAFTKFSKAFVTLNKKALIMAKIKVGTWFYLYGIPAHIHSDKGWHFSNEIMGHLHAKYGVKQATTTPYNTHGTSQCERFNCLLVDVLILPSK